MYRPTDRIGRTVASCFTSCGTLAGARTSSVGSLTAGTEVDGEPVNSKTRMDTLLNYMECILLMEGMVFFGLY